MDNYRRGLMTQYPCARGRAFVCKNIGDYIQSVASNQFIKKVDDVIEQEEADTYKSPDGRKCRLIMNGWFQWRAENWPPSDDVLPLLVSMHISPLRQEQLLSEKGINFLRKNSPVGCRDYYTMKLLQSKNINAYFSGCVTLTLGKKYHVEAENRNGVFFVDPYFDIPPLYENIEGKTILNENLLNDFIDFYSKHSEIINKLACNEFFKEYSPVGFLDKDNNIYRPYYKAYCFYKLYSKKFSDELISNANYITHWINVDMKNQSNMDLFNIAEHLVKQYASAKLVITSRIHAGLPCLGLDTPVVFIANDEITSESGKFNTPGRLAGLLEFFRVLKIEENSFETEDDVFMNIEIFNELTSFKNKDCFKPYAEKLNNQLSIFMSKNINDSDMNYIRSLPFENIRGGVL